MNNELYEKEKMPRVKEGKTLKFLQSDLDPLVFRVVKMCLEMDPSK